MSQYKEKLDIIGKRPVIYLLSLIIITIYIFYKENSIFYSKFKVVNDLSKNYYKFCDYQERIFSKLLIFQKKKF